MQLQREAQDAGAARAAAVLRQEQAREAETLARAAEQQEAVAARVATTAAEALAARIARRQQAAAEEEAAASEAAARQQQLQQESAMLQRLGEAEAAAALELAARQQQQQQEVEEEAAALGARLRQQKEALAEAAAQASREQEVQEARIFVAERRQQQEEALAATEAATRRHQEAEAAVAEAEASASAATRGEEDADDQATIPSQRTASSWVLVDDIHAVDLSETEGSEDTYSSPPASPKAATPTASAETRGEGSSSAAPPPSLAAAAPASSAAPPAAPAKAKGERGMIRRKGFPCRAIIDRKGDMFVIGNEQQTDAFTQQLFQVRRSVLAANRYPADWDTFIPLCMQKQAQSQLRQLWEAEPRTQEQQRVVEARYGGQVSKNKVRRCMDSCWHVVMFQRFGGRLWAFTVIALGKIDIAIVKIVNDLVSEKVREATGQPATFEESTRPPLPRTRGEDEEPQGVQHKRSEAYKARLRVKDLWGQKEEHWDAWRSTRSPQQEAEWWRVWDNLRREVVEAEELANALGEAGGYPHFRLQGGQSTWVPASEQKRPLLDRAIRTWCAQKGVRYQE